MITVLVALSAFGALASAAIALLRQRSLREALCDAQRRLYLVQARLHELENTMQKELQAVRTLVQRQAGGPPFEPTMKIADAVAIDPRVREVLARFHLGGCNACAIDEEHTIEQAALSYGADLERLMVALTSLSDGPESPPRAPQHGGLLQLTEL
jgi:hybrid cluster-associated redox disulfide protein